MRESLIKDVVPILPRPNIHSAIHQIIQWPVVTSTRSFFDTLSKDNKVWRKRSKRPSYSVSFYVVVTLLIVQSSILLITTSKTSLHSMVSLRMIQMLYFLRCFHSFTLILYYLYFHYLQWKYFLKKIVHIEWKAN